MKRKLASILMLLSILVSTIITYQENTPDVNIVCYLSEALTMLCGICLIISNKYFLIKEDMFLLLGAIMSLLGGFILPFSFILGLVIFLLAYASYLVYFKLGTPWFSSKLFLLFNLSIALTILAIIVIKVDLVLALAITLFVGVITVMVSQSMSKALIIKSKHYPLVVLGAWLIFIHDGIIGLDTFAFKIPNSSWIVIVLYGIGQYFITNYAVEKNTHL
jgi:uncharacterized membrane protein YhhN